MKHIHFVGICGIAMGSLALAFKQAGWKVTGSDVGFYPPMSTFLKESGVEYYAGWHPEKMGHPDLAIIGNVASSTNPEWIYIQKNNLGFLSYPEVIAKYFIKDKSIVCAGTYGKTTTSALLSFILTKSGYNPSYMFGGLTTTTFRAAKITDGDWSVLEGDEYKTSRWDNNAKFFSYQPTHLLLTAVEWDHADIYPTEKEYLEAFKKLIRIIPKNGLIVISERVSKDITETVDPDIKKITYGRDTNNDYYYQNISQSALGIRFEIINDKKKYSVHCPLLGDYNAENICGVFALAKEIGIETEKILLGLAEFPGLKRRLEKRGQINSADVYDDIAHSPTKAKSVLKNLREIYSGKIYAIFEPNTGNRQKESIPQYADAFAAADVVIIPRLTKIKLAKENSHPPFAGEELARIISQTHPQTQYIADDTALLNYLKQKTTANDAVVFLGSHGFRGMIDELVK